MVTCATPGALFLHPCGELSSNPAPFIPNDPTPSGSRVGLVVSELALGILLSEPLRHTGLRQLWPSHVQGRAGHHWGQL